MHIIVTGGTFDKEYNELNGQLYFKKTHTEELLRLGRCRIPLVVEELMLKDSLEMTSDDRNAILQSCVNCVENRIVITHGTDTMTDTGRHLANVKLNKTIVLTGAMIPYTFGSSDGLFNLGSAMAFAQSLPAGVYIAMNGRCFTYDNVRKNRESGWFEEINPG